MGGEHVVRMKASPHTIGSSPRGRGTYHRPDDGHHGFRFIPAWAGNMPNPTRKRCARPVHPRVGGEHRSYSASASASDGSSPRGRGTLIAVMDAHHIRRFIPAWAGNIKIVKHGSLMATVHPRVGGEHGGQSLAPALPIGSSPRGRGTFRL